MTLPPRLGERFHPTGELPGLDDAGVAGQLLDAVPQPVRDDLSGVRHRIGGRQSERSSEPAQHVYGRAFGHGHLQPIQLHDVGSWDEPLDGANASATTATGAVRDDALRSQDEPLLRLEGVHAEDPCRGGSEKDAVARHHQLETATPQGARVWYRGVDVHRVEDAAYGTVSDRCVQRPPTQTEVLGLLPGERPAEVEEWRRWERLEHRRSVVLWSRPGRDCPQATTNVPRCVGSRARPK